MYKSTKIHVNTKYCLDDAPLYLKKIYVTGIHQVKRVLEIMGLLSWLDKRATHSLNYHYLRSLFATHILEDMIALDVPWWTYRAINYLEQYLKQQNDPIHVFEYGSGASTIWLSKRCQSVTSIEHDPIWYHKLYQYATKSNIGNITLHLAQLTPNTAMTENIYLSPKMLKIDFSPYVNSIQSENKLFDVIVIDGRCRVACLSNAIIHLKPQGIIVFDNSNRARYQQVLNQSHFKISRFKGRVPGAPFQSETAILTRA